MAKGSDSMMAGGEGMSPRKAMGMGKGDSGAGGVTSLESGQSPKAIMGVKGGKELADHERGIGMPVSRGKGMHPGQANPDHGKTHPMGTGMEHYSGKA